MRFTHMVFNAALIGSLFFGQLSIGAVLTRVSDNDLYDPSLGDRISVFRTDNGRYVAMVDYQAQGINEGNINNKKEKMDFKTYGNAVEALNAVVLVGACGSVNKASLTCFTGIGNADISNAGIGDTNNNDVNTSGNGTNTSANGSNSTGSGTSSNATGGNGADGGNEMSNSSGSPAPSNAPSKTPSKAEQALIDALNSLAKMYVRVFDSLNNQIIENRRNLAVALQRCITSWGGGTPQHLECAKETKKYHDEEKQKIEKKIEQSKQQYNEDIEAVKKAYANTPSSLDAGNPQTSDPTQMGAKATGVNGTVNNSNTTNTTNTSNNTTINNTTVNNSGGSGTTGTGVSSSGGDGNGEKGETMSEFCKNNPNVIACMTAGSYDGGDGGEAKLSTHEQNIGNAYTRDSFLSGYTNYVCPAPLVVSSSRLGTLQIPFTGLCDFLQKIRGIVIAVFALSTGLFVLKGLR